MTLVRVSDTWSTGDHIVFRNLGRLNGSKGTKKTNTYAVTAKQHSVPLGSISWFPKWRKYAFDPLPDTVYEETCLQDIAAFIADETRRHKAGEPSEL